MTKLNKILAGMLAFATLAFPANSYLQHNLVSDIAGRADHQDVNLVNPWGLDRSPTSPWWVADNGMGVSTLYNGAGQPNSLVVTVPPPGATGKSAPTGIVFNGTPDFTIASGKPAFFIFATEDGTISGWNPTVNATNAILKVTTPNAVYKGLTMGQIDGANVLYAANFRAASVDVFDRNYNPVSLSSTAFKDPRMPAGFAPFNVQNINGKIYVAFAKQDAARHDDVPGEGLGLVSVFSAKGDFLARLESGKWLNAPWAMTLAPANFGKLSNRLLVGNFGSGQIASYDLSGEFQGLMRGPKGKPVTIDGLWGLRFGNGAAAGPANVLFFTAGINGEANGLFGTLTAGNPDAEGDDDN
jgi:uncharacterized protein (TIGR03118 family)